MRFTALLLVWTASTGNLVCLAVAGLVVAGFPAASLASPAPSVAPAFVSVHVRQSQQFTLEPAASHEAVTWRVNGVPGGNATVGKVTAEGLYTAPAFVPAGTTVTLAAQVAGAAPIQVTVAIGTGLDFYVSTTGNDLNPGTLDEPWKTIQHAANRALAGDTVYIRGGTYHEAVTIVGTGSQSSGALVFQSYPGEQAIIDGTSVPWPGMRLRGLVSLLNEHNYVIVEGLEVRNFSSSIATQVPVGILFVGSGTGDKILNNTVHGIVETAGTEGEALGISVSGNATTPIADVTVSGNVLYGLKLGRAESLLFDGDVEGFTASSNTIHDNDNIGIDATGFYGSGPAGHDQAKNGVIEDNTIYNISTIGNPSYLAYAADGVYCDGCSNVVIERNQIYACDQGVGAASENAGRYSAFVTIRDNVIYDSNMNGIAIGSFVGGGGSADIKIVNNTILHSTGVGWGNALELGGQIMQSIFENNIVDATVPGALVLSGNSAAPWITIDHNVYYSGAKFFEWQYQGCTYFTFADYQKPTGQDQHSRFTSPRLLSVQAPFDLDLEPVSPARAAGNFALGQGDYGGVDYAGNPRTTGATINAGAYQK